MFDKEFPTQIRVFAGLRMKRGNLRDFWRIPSARFQDKNPETILREIAGKRTAASARANDDEIVLRRLLFWVKSGVVHFAEDTPRPTRACVLECFEQIDQVVEFLFAQIFRKVMATIEDQIRRSAHPKKLGYFFASSITTRII